MEGPLQNHLLKLGSDIGFFSDLGNNRVQDVFGVVWDRSVDRDIGNVEGQVLAQPSLAGYEFPDPLDPRFFADIPERLPGFRIVSACSRSGSRFTNGRGRCGMEPLMMDFYDRPEFVHELLGRIADYNIAQVREA